MEPLEDRALLATTTVDVVNFTFTPNSVTIHMGDTVHWVWETDNHSTTSVAGSAEQWDSGVHNTGFTFDHTFTNTGTFVYYCKIHGQDNGNGTANGMSGTITVLPVVTLTTITVTPANTSIATGTTQQYTAMGHFSDNTSADITNQVTWASTNTAVATISNAAGSQGLASAVGPGTTTIMATEGTITGSTGLTVNSTHLVSIAVSPDRPSVAKGLIKQFTATGTLSDGSTQDLTSQVTWASANTAVATISNAAGMNGLATTVATGTSTISATFHRVTGTTVLTVTPAALEMIMVSPVNPSVIQGQTEPFMAMGMFSDNSTQDLTTQVTWTSANTGVATITAAGVATGVAPGTSTITAALHGMSGSTQLTVTALPPPPPPLVTVASVQLTENRKHQVTGITIDFSGAVNAAEADSPAIYRLAMPGKKGSFDAKNAKVIKLKSAVYDGTRDAVTLTPRKPFALTKPVQVRINGLPPSGLQDTSGRLIDGNHDGQPGGNATAVLTRRGVTLDAVVARVSGGSPAIRAVTAAATLDPVVLIGITTPAEFPASKPRK
jgi:plastocyanin